MGKGIWRWVLVLLLPALGCGSGSSGHPDTGDVVGDQQEAGDGADVEGGGDVEAHDGGDADADGADVPDAAAKHTVIELTAGGGRISSTGYQLTLSIGAPQPMGAAQSGTQRVHVGPGAALNQ